MVGNLSFSQSSYPIQKVIDGDTFVILTKGQADTINSIFESQKAKIAKYKAETRVKDSIISIRDTLLIYYTNRVIEYNTIIDKEIERVDRLDTISEWLYKRAVEGSWLYYSYQQQSVVAVDLSDYIVRKNDSNGDLLFYKMTPDCNRDDKNDKEPPLNWQTDIALPSRPKLNILKLKQIER